MSREGSKRSTGTKSTKLDEQMMARAIALGRRGEGRVEPNPMVGCVIVQRQRIIGSGYHRRFGGSHAEVEALGSCLSSPRGATVYVSLEPCSHQGKTPPCTAALIEAGVGRVVFAVRDPSEHAGGRATRLLRQAGIEVMSGVMELDAVRLLAPFLISTRLPRPYVIAKWAQSLDGRMATTTGQSKWITSQQSRLLAHRIRARVDAVMVGAGTALVDDPFLTARGVPIRRRAIRVVLDSRLRIAEACHLTECAEMEPGDMGPDEMKTGGSPRTVVFTSTAKARSPKAKRLVSKGVSVIPCSRRGAHLSLRACLRKLQQLGVTNVLVEGGPRLLTSLLRDQLVDEAQVFVSPRLMGGEGSSGMLGRFVGSEVVDALSPRSVHTRRIGPDLLYRLALTSDDTLLSLCGPAKR